MASLAYWIWLSAASVSPKAKAALIRHFGDAEKAWLSPKGAFSSVPGVTSLEAERLEQRDLSQVSVILGACEEQGLQILTYQDAAYPARLRNIFAPPVVLYAKGKLPELDREAAVAVIGTRKASVYGLKMSRDMAFQICRCGGMVVSLLTHGIDAEAARGALLAEGSCVGVLGTPHEEEHSRLAQELSVRGCLLSEYPPGRHSQKQFFRERNRIAAGLSVALVVVEAPERSGTRLFAQDALEQGKEIFAVPGNVNAENSAGTLSMLKDGANLATCGWDVLQDFQILFPGKLRDAGSDPAPFTGTKAPPAPPPEPVREEKVVDKPAAPDYIDLRTQLSGLPEDQLAILSSIDPAGTHVDDIILRTGLPTASVLRHLTILAIKNYVKRNPGNFYQLNITKK